MKLRYFLFLIAAILLSIDKADAGDWGFIRFAIPWNGDQVTYGDDSDFKIIGKNYNETFAVTGITYSLKFYQLPDEKLVFRKDMEGDDAQPGKQVEVNFGKVDWTNIGIGRLRIDFSMTYDFDENPSNNDSSKEIEVVSPYISRDSASGIFRNYILDKYSKLNLSYSVGYMLQDVKLKGTMINTDIYDSGGTATDKDYWIGWFNTDYTLFYSHPSSLIMIDAIKGEVDKEIPLNFWPRINNVIYPNDTQLDFDRILGKPREDDVLDTNSYLYEIGNNQNTKGPCALLIAGLGQDSRQRNGFDRSAEVMKREFQREARGPQIPDSNIKLLKNPTDVDVLDALDEMVDCGEVYIYYVGHGDSTDGMVLSNDLLPFRNLIRIVLEQEHTKYHFMIDCCYSGLFIDELMADSLKRGKNITVITSSRRDTVSKFLPRIFVNKTTGDTIHTGIGFMTEEIALCFGDSTADVNKDGKISLKEAMDCALKNNHVISTSDTTRFRKFGPRIYTQNTGSTKTASLDFGGTDMYVNVIKSPGDANLNVSLMRGRDLFDVPEDSRIYHASRNRIWDISMDNSGNQDFELELGFRVNDTWDDLPDGPGTIGAIYRMEPAGKWFPHYPSVYDETRNVVKSQLVDHLSQWALARVEEESGVEDTNTGNGIFLSAYPNPFRDAAVIRFTLKSPAHLKASVYNALGSLVEPLAEDYYNTGTYSLIYNGSGFPGGVYFVKINIGQKIYVYKLLKSE